ncbi:MAG: orotidine-5'-phosphate decarboxylase [Alphaproteobacteria bacterium]|jgi:orotidine-5'-phosphate decarboxylase|uniref:Orotidine 5'-phosphate decarboxylase n=1 Tax=Brevundimonas mediterranea TaxID=74329 RepID=A0AB37E7F0_9CAUL|nr:MULTISPECIES: orotidine-5'-phosphate decarboxylase [Brevundimonas]MBU1270967.1 orotidine-5'-phosphate decarboxylase [Alphaproteobacteria bacterium]OGN47693.1 MAG: orotidine 5'-phosphate decarboxylase [Caulobacterales bacterium RIFCSPHIGHO2_12_FULL_68_13]OYX72598.1 MAG: orotidine 5'-phosphate decarboxylase [Brevundimonas sp. 32-68-21]KDP93147.1 orotidine 5'-phosphate decarboxylase [Brevundimonas sp. EAKA]MBA4330837.1 orotidine-5'-phosphate decarboxylase [Brevundimonas sp.]
MTQTETLAPNRGPDERIICALDVPTIAEAAALVARVQDAVGFYKIGLQLFAAGGMDLARDLKTEGRKVFLDWKLHDIGATVEKAAANLADAGCDLLTVHARPQVMAAAARGVAGSGLKVLGVTVLTSLTAEDLAADDHSLSPADLVERRVRQALEAGIDGVVSSPHEAARVREIAVEAGRPDFLIVTPGVRPAGSALDDQARAATPEAALQAGATHLVIGRPITAAADPRAAALAVAESIALI